MSIFSKIKQTISLLQSIDLDALAKISKKIDLPETMAALGKMDDGQLKGLMKMLESQNKKGKRNLPPIDGDFYDLSLKLTAEQRELQLKVRNFMVMK